MEIVNPNREYKDRFFKKVFSDKRALLNLYNAVNNSDYDNPEDIEINTIEDFLYMGMKNDVSFLFTDVMSLYEQQSTFNPNMPFRGFIYLAKLFEKTVYKNHDFYGSKLIRIPNPQFIVFYNGTRDEPDKRELRLSDAFGQTDQLRPCIECTAIMLNINYDHNRELMEKCAELKGYAILVGKIRAKVADLMSLDTAVDEAIDECIKDGILREILEAHRMEARDMLFTEYDEETHLRNVHKEGYEEGMDAIVALYKALLDSGRLKEYERAMEDRDYRLELMKEFKLS